MTQPDPLPATLPAGTRTTNGYVSASELLLSAGRGYYSGTFLPDGIDFFSEWSGSVWVLNIDSSGVE